MNDGNLVHMVHCEQQQSKMQHLAGHRDCIVIAKFYCVGALIGFATNRVARASVQAVPATSHPTSITKLPYGRARPHSLSTANHTT